jgi:hypothetical protein
MFRPLLPLDALPSAALSDRQLEVNCAGMLEGLRAVHAAEVAPCTRSRLSEAESRTGKRRQDLGRETGHNLHTERLRGLFV